MAKPPPIRLIHRVTVQRQSTEPETSPSGEQTYPLEELGPYSAYVRELRGNEAVNAKQVVSTASHAVYMRTSIGPINTQDQLLWRGRVLSIGSIVNDPEMNGFYEVLVSELK